MSSAPPAASTGGHLAVNEVSAATAPGSALTQTNDKSALALYCNNTLPFHSTDRTYHTDHIAHTRIRFSHPSSARRLFLLFPSLFKNRARTHSRAHTHREKLNKCGNRCPTSDCSCPLLPARLQRDRGVPLTKIRHRSPLLSRHMPTVNTHSHTHARTFLSYLLMSISVQSCSDAIRISV